MRQIEPKAKLILIKVRFHALAKLIECFVVLAFAQMRKFVHHDHSKKLRRSLFEQGCHAKFILCLEFLPLDATDVSV